MIDTNILVAALYSPGSASARVVAACVEGRLRAVVSPALLQEYRYILPRAIRGRPWESLLDQFIAAAIAVDPPETPPVVSADPDDDALFAAAVEGLAAVIVTNDRPVLQIKVHVGIRVVRPPACLEELLGIPWEGPRGSATMESRERPGSTPEGSS